MPHILIVDPLDEGALLKLKEKFKVTIKLKPTNSELSALIADTDIIILRSSVELNETVLKIAKNLKICFECCTDKPSTISEQARVSSLVWLQIRPRILFWRWCTPAHVLHCLTIQLSCFQDVICSDSFVTEFTSRISA
jgi:hypothetical protein